MKLTKEEKLRVDICKDALKHLKAKRIELQQDYFITLPDFASGCDLQTMLKKFAKAKKPCKTCARGGLFFSHVWRNDGYTCRYLGFDNVINPGVAADGAEENNILNKIFGMENLRKIEACFEREEPEYARSLSKEMTKRVFAFADRYKTPANRFRAILNNMIKNKGIFTP